MSQQRKVIELAAELELNMTFWFSPGNSVTGVPEIDGDTVTVRSYNFDRTFRYHEQRSFLFVNDANPIYQEHHQ